MVDAMSCQATSCWCRIHTNTHAYTEEHTDTHIITDQTHFTSSAGICLEHAMWKPCHAKPPRCRCLNTHTHTHTHTHTYTQKYTDTHIITDQTHFTFSAGICLEHAKWKPCHAKPPRCWCRILPRCVLYLRDRRRSERCNGTIPFPDVCVFVYVCVNVCMYVCMYVYICMYEARAL